MSESTNTCAVAGYMESALGRLMKDAPYRRPQHTYIPLAEAVMDMGECKLLAMRGKKSPCAIAGMGNAVATHDFGGQIHEMLLSGDYHERHWSRPGYLRCGYTVMCT